MSTGTTGSQVDPDAPTPEDESGIEARHTFDVLFRPDGSSRLAVVAVDWCYGARERYLFHNGTPGTSSPGSTEIVAVFEPEDVLGVIQRDSQPVTVAQHDGRGHPVPGAERSRPMPPGPGPYSPGASWMPYGSGS